MKTILNKTLILLTGCLLATITAPAQKNDAAWKNAIGLRAGGTSGLTYKHRFSKSAAAEFIFSFSPGITGLFEKYSSTNEQGLSWYYGGGAHFSFNRYNNRYFFYHKGRYYYSGEYYYGHAFGVDGIVGLEYKIPAAPIAFSVDVKPNLEMTTGGHVFMYLDPGLGIKVAF